jgi:hypothetical protein
MATEVPAVPSFGTISLKEGAPAAVVVAAAVVVEVTAVTTVVDITRVGAAVGIDETVTCVIFTMYSFSKVERGNVSVAEFVRYPQDPSLFLWIYARV